MLLIIDILNGVGDELIFSKRPVVAWAIDLVAEQVSYSRVGCPCSQLPGPL